MHRIHNFKELATNELRTDALSVAEAGYAAIDVGEALARTLHIENGELHVADGLFPWKRTRLGMGRPSADRNVFRGPVL